MSHSPVSLAYSSLPHITQRPHFVTHPGDLDLCVHCKQVLRPNVKQTPCGHRLCGVCVYELFRQGDSATCPGGEEDCVLLRKHEVRPDNATNKDLLRRKVYCPNTAHGCNATVTWRDVHKHADTCPFREVTCTNAGCEKTLLASDLEHHVRDTCEHTHVLCENCDTYMPRKHALNGHAKQCALLPRKCAFESLGCAFVGTPDKYQEHLTVSLAQHTKETVNELNNIKSEHEELQSDVTSMQVTVHDLEAAVETLNKDSQNKQAFTSLQTFVAKLGDEMNALKIQVDQSATSTNLQACTENINNVKQVSAMLESRIAYLENGNNHNNSGGDVVEKVNRIERTVGMHDVRIAESDLRFRLLETAAFDGRLIWRIPSYSRRKQDAVEGRTLSLYSQPFYSSYYGFKMCARVYLNGDGLGKGSHLSLFFVLMRGEYDSLLSWPFRQRVTLSLLDQSGNRRHITDTFRPDPTSTSFRKPMGEMNVASGSPMFAPHGKVESEPYLKDDTLFICITIDKTDLPEPWV